MTRELANRVLTWGAWTLLVVSIIGWPTSALTLAKDEPPFILGLSWLAIIVECLVFLVSAYIKKEQDSGES